MFRYIYKYKNEKKEEKKVAEYSKEEYIKRIHKFNEDCAKAGCINMEGRLEVLAYQLSRVDTGHHFEADIFMSVVTKYLRNIHLKEELSNFDKELLRIINGIFDSTSKDRFIE